MRYAAAASDRPVLIRLAAARRLRSARAERTSSGRRVTPARQRHPRARVVVQRTRRPGALSFAAWLARAETRKIRACESGGDYTLVDSHTGTAYYGAWQMDADFVATYAGVRAADYVEHGRFTLGRAAQDEAAYRGYLARGDEPWACR